MKNNSPANGQPPNAVPRWLRFTPPARVRISDAPRHDRIAVLLPVLNEAERLAPCLDSLLRQPKEICEILVVDGGSTDGTQEIVERYHARDSRVRLVDASPVDPSWTGKAWGLHVGLEASSPRADWILCVDADVQASPVLARSLLDHAQRTGVKTFSLAAGQRLAGPADALVHPALLTTLVYRFGSPGRATTNLHRVLANGQCFISRRDILLRTGAFAAARASLCEDITIARRIAECGEPVGFYEGEGLIEVSMYADWRETWDNWPRSLPMRDQYFGAREWLGLLQVSLLQALPLPVFLMSAIGGGPLWLTAIAGGLALLRMGVLLGVARAYPRRPWSYWLSPLMDLPAAVKILASALARRHVWRGRVYVRRAGGTFEPL